MTDKKIACYLAGAMESVGGNMNFPLFAMVAAKLTELGCIVYSPAAVAFKELGTPEEIRAMPKAELKTRRRELIAAELAWICKFADVMLMLPGWQQSPGAFAEHAVAIALDIPVHELPDVIVLDDPSVIQHFFDKE